MTPDDLFERGLGPSERLRDQTGFGDAVEIDLYGGMSLSQLTQSGPAALHGAAKRS